MKNEIKLINVFDSANFKKIDELYNDPEINATFSGYRTDRIAASEINFLICLNDEPIGFILLVRENERKNSLGIDMAIKKKYRDKGYGKKAMEMFKNKFLKLIEENLHAQVKKDNIAAHKMLDILNTEYIESINGSDFYKISNKKK